MLRELLLSLVFLLITTSPVLAVSWPPEVKPEQGRASGTLGTGDEQLTVTINFWNVGEVGGSEYAEATVDLGCAQKTIGDWKCTADENPPSVGTFSGGPNGKITINKNTIQLANGNKFTSELEKTFQATVDNPEIFSKYRWSMDEAPPIPKISGDKYAIETIGAARFNDLYGQVEVNIPNSDGTYDDEKWDFAKVEMELPPGTRIKVGEKSGLLLTFPDTQTVITVGPETEIVLVDVTQEKMSMEGSPWGKLKASVKRLLTDGQLEIEMSQAVAGIKGTVFSLEDTKDKSTIHVMEGSVEFKSKATGQTEMVSAGETLSADTNGLGTKTTFDPVTEEKQWQELEDNLKKTNTNILGNKNLIYFVGGIVVTAIAISFLLLKVRKRKK